MSTQRILIVDDDQAILLTLAASIEKVNPTYEVVTCKSGEEALTHIANCRFALLLTDYSMPGMNGLDLARVVQERSPETRIIMMTAYGSDTLRAQAAELNLSDFIDKPFTVKEIRDVINRVMSDIAATPHTPV